MKRWDEAAAKAKRKRNECRRTEGKTPCGQSTCPRCNPLRIGRQRLTYARGR